jgi:hypothetical protein
MFQPILLTRSEVTAISIHRNSGKSWARVQELACLVKLTTCFLADKKVDGAHAIAVRIAGGVDKLRGHPQRFGKSPFEFGSAFRPHEDRAKLAVRENAGQSHMAGVR